MGSKTDKKLMIVLTKEDAFSDHDPCSYDCYLSSSEEDLKNSGLNGTQTLTSGMLVQWSTT